MQEPTPNANAGLWRLCRWACGYAVRRWSILLLVLVSLLLRVGLDVLKPWPMVFLIDYVLRSEAMPSWVAGLVAMLPGVHTPEALAGWSVAATVLVFVLGWAFGVVGSYGDIALGQRMTYDLAGDLFAKLQQLSLHFHARKSVGDSIRRVTSDATCVSVIVKDALLPILSSVVSLVAMFLVLWRIDATLALLAVAVVPYMIFVFHRYSSPMMMLSYEQQQIEGRIYDVVEQTFSAIPVVQAFGREELNDRWFSGVAAETISVTMKLTRVQLAFKVLMGLATAAGTSAILWVGARHVLSGALEVGTILAVVSYLWSLYGPLEAIMYTNATLQGAAGSAQRVWEILRTPTRVADSPSARPIPRAQGNLEFEEVTFAYEPNRPVLRNLSVKVSAGTTIALVGATGAGKSTLVSLVCRFFDPIQGRVLLDGRDLREVQLKSLRQNISIVLQEPFLFPISIADNIAYGLPAAGLEQIETAARAARAHEFIQKLPEGYQTIVGEWGATLSGGERQRISIARALLKNAPVLILDEPTSALDAETEQALMEALDHLTQGRTTFIIAHRLSTIRRAHRILVLKEGMVVESGTHEELLARKGEYAWFYELQTGGASVKG